MKNDFTCPFCNHTFPLIPDTYKCYEPSFVRADSSQYPQKPTNMLFVKFYSCPHCKKVSIRIDGGTNDFQNLHIPIYPNSLAKKFPEYIPQAIREDYEESYSILYLSPKASAALARRCLQGMIRDFWGISKSKLVDAINALQEKVPVSQWKAIDSVRSIGNIGAHMEKDVNVIIEVEPYEAEKLLKLIELLIDKWYIARHDEEELLADIVSIADDKNAQKQSTLAQ